MEWLGEIEIDEIEPEFGFEDAKHPEKMLKGRLFLVMSDQVALGQILSLFDQWRENHKLDFPPRLAPLKRAFQFLHAIRPWDATDRLAETGILDDWEERIAAGQTVVPFEAELWFRGNGETRSRTMQILRGYVNELGGEIATDCTIDEIGYHAVLGRIPVENVERFAAHENIALLQCDQVMFFRPVGQCAVPAPAVETGSGVDVSAAMANAELPTGEPIVALLDGLPLSRHRVLDGRVVIDDPDSFETGYPADSRSHGTAMASLICRGDLQGSGLPMAYPLYVRPIMKARQRFDGQWEEAIPDDVLTVDLIHRAVRRLFEGEGGEPPTAPGVRIINLSMGDRSRSFDRAMSPWARLLDWLSEKYGVLFIVSAGNYTNQLELDVPRQDLGSLSQEDLESAVIRAIAADSGNRRLLSPAETINGITVGGLHDDYAGLVPSQQIDPYLSRELPATYTAHGLGYRRSVKPEILLAGGRMVFTELKGNTHSKATLQCRDYRLEPGQKVAAPAGVGSLSATKFCCGTSNAAALTSRAGVQLFEMIESLRAEGAGLLPVEYDAVIVKALLVHGAAWGNAFKRFGELLRDRSNSQMFKAYLSRFLGYGAADIEKVKACAAQRVTVLGVGSLEPENAEVFQFPLPPCLSAETAKRRMIVTLAYISPVSPTRQAYRKAHLWVNPKNSLTPDRQEAEYRMVQRGTVQHEILDGKKALDFQDGTSLAFKVSCREDADHVASSIRYALAVTLEVAPALNLPIYEQVRAALAVPVVSRL